MNKIMHGGLPTPSTSDLQLCANKCAMDYVSKQQESAAMQSCVNSCVTTFTTQHPQTTHTSQTSAVAPHQQTSQQQQELCATNCAKNNCPTSMDRADRMSCANRCVAQCKSH